MSVATDFQQRLFARNLLSCITRKQSLPRGRLWLGLGLRSRCVSCAAAKSPSPVTVEQKEMGSTKLTTLKQKMELLGIKCDDSFVPGRYHLLFCPKCRGGQSLRRTLSLHVIENANFAMWRCFHSECGWADQASADIGGMPDRINRDRSSWETTVESLGLKPPGNEVRAYFSERKISEETLQRNGVMQLTREKGRRRYHEIAIAFTYRKNDELVGCKYRTLGRKFWQEKGTEKFLYGLNDINDADEIIIVEGEADKLSVEEAGFFNCVSVPGGAPGTVSTKPLPPLEKDSGFQYLWNCKEYLDKASRIILATDDDKPGHALAEELARRLGKERCWRVKWPRKDESSSYKDANEVLKNMGPAALREVIESAESNWESS